MDAAPPAMISAMPPSANASSLSSRAESRTPSTASRDGSAHSLDDERIGSFERPREGRFRENGHVAVPSADEPQDVRPHQQDRVESPQTLHANADPGVFSEVDGERRLHAKVAPLPPTMNDHAFAAVLGNPEGLWEAGREGVDGVDPGAPPEVARLLGRLSRVSGGPSQRSQSSTIAPSCGPSGEQPQRRSIGSAGRRCRGSASRESSPLPARSATASDSTATRASASP